MDGFRDVPITTAENVTGRGKQPVVGMPSSEEFLRAIRRKRLLLDEKIRGLDLPWVWTRSRDGGKN